MRVRRAPGTHPRRVFSVVLVVVASVLLGSTAGIAETRAAPDVEKTISRHMRGKRYCEVLLVTPTEGGIVADVYNSYPLNDCPEGLWAGLDGAAIAAEHRAPVALLNGPRYWLMDRIAKFGGGERITETFGGIDMTKAATVDIGSLADAATKYESHFVDRSTVFTFKRGATVYELLAADGERYVMQAWSQQVDSALDEANLAGLGDRLQLPDGWTYRSRTLRTPLRVVTTTTKAAVLQDDLQNSYSRETG